MKKITDEAFKFLCDAYEETLDDWFDDPDEQFTGWTPAEFAEWYRMMLRIGEECGTEFWTVAAAEATDYEIDRVKTMLKEAGVPGYLNYEPQADE